ADVQIIGSQFPPEAVEISTSFGWIARPGLGEHRNFVARYVLEGLRHMGMAAVGVGGVKKSQAVVVAVEEQIGQTLHAQSSLMRVMSAAHGAGSHREPARGNIGLPEGYGIRRSELAGPGGQGMRPRGQTSPTDQRCSHSAGCAYYEFSPLHGASSLMAYAVGRNCGDFGYHILGSLLLSRVTNIRQ